MHPQADKQGYERVCWLHCQASVCCRQQQHLHKAGLLVEKTKAGACMHYDSSNSLKEAGCCPSLSTHALSRTPGTFRTCKRSQGHAKEAELDRLSVT
jgi:hypothetical protein